MQRQVITAAIVSSLMASAASALVISFQDGVNGYNGTRDTMIRSNVTGSGSGQSSNGDSRDRNFGSLNFVSVDGDDGSPDLKPNHGLIRFDHIFGSASGQIPVGSTIHSALLTLTVFDAGSGMMGYQVYAPWEELTVTWNNFGTPNDGALVGVDTASTALFSIGANNSSANVSTGVYNFNITMAAQNWSMGAPNWGIALIPFINGTNGIDFRSREFATVSARPKLTVEYTAPVVAPAVPEPAMLGVLSTVAGLFALMRRRR